MDRNPDTGKALANNDNPSVFQLPSPAGPAPRNRRDSPHRIRNRCGPERIPERHGRNLFCNQWLGSRSGPCYRQASKVSLNFQASLRKRKLLMNHQHEPKKTSTKRKPLADLTPEERKLIEYLEKEERPEFAPQEVNLALGQAREIGDL